MTCYGCHPSIDHDSLGAEADDLAVGQLERYRPAYSRAICLMSWAWKLVASSSTPILASSWTGWRCMSMPFQEHGPGLQLEEALDGAERALARPVRAEESTISPRVIRRLTLSTAFLAP